MIYAVSILGIVAIVVVVGMIDYRLFFKKRKQVAETFKRLSTKYGEVEYLDWGKPEDPPILISYGGGTGIDFIYSLDWLRDAGFRLIAVNRPGYYHLPVDAVDSIEGHADIYHTVVQHLGIDTVRVFALSMGGLSGLYYAQKYPTQSLVLWCAITGPYTVNQDSVNSPLGRLVMSEKGKKMISWMMSRSAQLFPKETIASFITTEAHLDKKAIHKLAKEISSDPKERKRMQQFIASMAPMHLIYEGMMDEVKKSETDHGIQWNLINMPVLAIASIIDKDVSMDHIERVENEVEGAKIMHVQNAGHFIWWGEEKESVLSETVDFFQNN